MNHDHQKNNWKSKFVSSGHASPTYTRLLYVRKIRPKRQQFSVWLALAMSSVQMSS